MANRREMICAINLIRHAARSNVHFRDITDGLDGKRIFTKYVNDIPITMSFDEKKARINFEGVFLKKLTDKIKTVINKADSGFLNSGIEDLSYRVAQSVNHFTKQKIDDNMVSVNNKCSQLPGSIGLFSDDIGLKTLVPDFRATNTEIGFIEPDPWELFPKEVNHANILHNILDALSYELRGIDSYRGQPLSRPQEQKEKLYNNRIHTANVYLSKLPNNLDRADLGNVLSYTENEFAKDQSNEHCIEIGQYIDTNLPKLISVMRSWAL